MRTAHFAAAAAFVAVAACASFGRDGAPENPTTVDDDAGVRLDGAHTADATTDPGTDSAVVVDDICTKPDVFCDDFEHGIDSTQWTSSLESNGGSATIAEVVRGTRPGNHVLRSASSGQGGQRVDAMLIHALSRATPLMATRAWVHRDMPAAENFGWLWMTTARYSDPSGGHYLHGPAFQADRWRIASAVDEDYGFQVDTEATTPVADWVCVELDILLGRGGAGGRRLFLDGKLVAESGADTIHEASYADPGLAKPELFFGMIYSEHRTIGAVDYDDLVTAGFDETTFPNGPRLGACK